MGKVIVTNAKAKYDYQVLEKLLSGLVLSGAEAKSLRLGKGSLRDSHVIFRGGEAFVINMNIPRYRFADVREYDPVRTRKLLLNKKEIESLHQKTNNTGLTVVPLAVVLEHNQFKLEIAVVRGKKQHEKRQVIRERDLKREVLKDLKYSIK